MFVRSDNKSTYFSYFRSIRQACAVWLKNRIDKSYFIDADIQKADQTPLATSDRVALKSHILQILVTAPNRALRVQLAKALKLVTMRDFPDEWPGYLDTVTALLSSQDPREVYAGLTATVEPVKAFRYRPSTKALDLIVDRTFPHLLRIGQQLVANSTTPMAAEFLHLIFQSYKNAAVSALLPSQCAGENILPWGKLMLDMVSLSVPPLPGLDEADLEKHEWWKAKKWAYGSLNILFTRSIDFFPFPFSTNSVPRRYGNPQQMPPTLQKKYKTFAENFIISFAPKILEVYLEQIKLYVAQEAWLSKRALYFIGQFLSEW